MAKRNKIMITIIKKKNNLTLCNLMIYIIINWAEAIVAPIRTLNLLGVKEPKLSVMPAFFQLVFISIYQLSKNRINSKNDERRNYQTQT